MGCGICSTVLFLFYSLIFNNSTASKQAAADMGYDTYTHWEATNEMSNVVMIV